jgi:hypothetical protein
MSCYEEGIRLLFFCAANQDETNRNYQNNIFHDVKFNEVLHVLLVKIVKESPCISSHIWNRSSSTIEIKHFQVDVDEWERGLD